MLDLKSMLEEHSKLVDKFDKRLDGMSVVGSKCGSNIHSTKSNLSSSSNISPIQDEAKAVRA